jgi:hypothetical protein
MSARTIYLSRLIGLFLLIAGLDMFVRHADFANTIMLMVKDVPLMYVTGLIALTVGLAVVLTHNIWSGLPAIVVTLIGWMSLLKGVFLLFLSSGWVASIAGTWDYPGIGIIYGCVFVILGAYLTYAGFSARATATA